MKFKSVLEGEKAVFPLATAPQSQPRVALGLGAAAIVFAYKSHGLARSGTCVIVHIPNDASESLIDERILAAYEEVRYDDRPLIIKIISNQSDDIIGKIKSSLRDNLKEFSTSKWQDCSSQSELNDFFANLQPVSSKQFTVALTPSNELIFLTTFSSPVSQSARPVGVFETISSGLAKIFSSASSIDTPAEDSAQQAKNILS